MTALGKPRQGKVSRKGIASDHVKKINLFFDDCEGKTKVHIYACKICHISSPRILLGKFTFLFESIFSEICINDRDS